MLSTNVRTHYMLVKEGDRNQIKKIRVTKSQVTLYKEELKLKKHNDFIEIHDIDTDEVLFDGRANKVEGFEEIKQDTNLQHAVYTCEYGTRHPLSQGGECDCMQKFDCLGFTVKDWLKENGIKVQTKDGKEREIEYASDITEEMQRKFLNRNK